MGSDLEGRFEIERLEERIAPAALGGVVDPNGPDGGPDGGGNLDGGPDGGPNDGPDVGGDN